MLSFIRRNLLSIVLIAAVTGYLGWQRYSAWSYYQVLLEKKAPQFVLQAVNEQTFTADNLMGRKSLLVFWATWCPSCRSEIPVLNEIHQAHAGQHFQLLSFVLPRQESPAAIRQFLQEHSISYPVLYDNARVADQFRVTALPTLVWVNESGIIEDIHIGSSFGLKGKVEDWVGRP
ncbi:MAG: TlpA family protein disulfide reductase [Leptospiraceae bacterium]|nr:TlpA family protein disulfide reductase [Leptospiraceae bacterium]